VKGDGDPFPGLLDRISRRRHLALLAEEGLFPVAIPATEPAPLPPLRAASAPPGRTELARPRAAPPPAPPAAAEEDETLTYPVAPARAAAPEPAAEPMDEPPATATLGELYLRQGHLAEAARIFRAVLREDPDNAAARAGLSAAAGPPEPAAAAGDGARAAAGAGGESLTERKVRLLKRYLAALRSAAERDVS
jgi:hypothetical protein